VSDHDLDRELADRLARRARPASPRVLDTALARIRTVPQARAAHGAWMDRAVLAVALAGVLVLAVLAGPPAVDRLAGLTGGPRQTGASSQPGMLWSGALQFRAAPNQQNPVGDGYGNDDVFSYLRNGGSVDDPVGYLVLPDFASDGIDRWYDPNVPGLYLGLGPGPNRLELRPSGGGDTSHAAILAWRSPVDASVTVTGSIEVDAACGDGILFSIHQGVTTIEQRALANGTVQFTDDVVVRTGETLYVLVAPGANDQCDTSWLTVDIATQ
jgi:hypothetical protein